MQLRKTMFITALLGSTIAATAFAENSSITGCSPTAQRAQSENGAAGSMNMANHKTEAEGGAGGNWQPTPGSAVQRTEAQAGGSANHKTEAEGGAGGNWQPTPGSAVQRTEAMAGSTGPFNPATRPAASAPCN